MARVCPKCLLLLLVSILSPCFGGLPSSEDDIYQGDVSAQMDLLLRRAYPPDQPGAAILVRKGDQILLRKGYGMANLEKGMAIHPEMLFRLGSLTKQFTAAAIMILAGQGRVSVNDDLTRFLPDYPTQGRHITVEHLLTHTSGIASTTIKHFENEPMEFLPGEHWRYNNAGYILLNAIVRKASGMSYEGFLQTRIFGAAGMKSTSYGSPSQCANCVVGYERSGWGGDHPSYTVKPQPYALYSNVDDLALWDAALYTDKILQKELQQRMYTPFLLNGGAATGYGYGWQISSYQGHKIVQHAGNTDGFSTYLLRIPDEQVLVIILSNNPSVAATPAYLARKLAADAMGKPIKDPIAAHVDSGILESYTGTYKLDQNLEIKVSRDGGRLLAQRSDTPLQEIIPESQADFYLPNSFVKYSFRKDATGRVTYLLLQENEWSVRASRIFASSASPQ